MGSLRNKDAEVIEVSKTDKKSFAPGLYDLTELQRDANRIFSFSAKETLSIMQKLYESHKVLTYPRTDSRYLTTDIVDTLKDRVKAVAVGPYSKVAFKVLKGSIKGNKSFVDNSKVSDHHAIIPTEEVPDLSAFNDKERKIYDLVVKRFLAVLYPPFEYNQISVTASIGGEHFIAKGKVILAQGWKEVYDNSFDEDDGKEDIREQIMPNLNKGDMLKVISLTETKGDTKPPAPFNEGTLLSAMENPVKYMDTENSALKKTIGETGGLGTVATRADIIEKLFNTFVIEKRGKDIFITSKGKQLLELVPEDLKSPTLTAQWEQKLAAIAKGNLNKDTYINEMKNYAKQVVNEIKSSEERFKHDNMTRNKCPECGKYMLEVNGKKGKMLVCQDRECGYRKGVARVTNARCPECKKRLEIRGEGEGQIYACPNSNCNFREKVSVFNKRFEKSDKVNKKEVNNLMRKMKKEAEEDFNNPFADLLKNFK